VEEPATADEREPSAAPKPRIIVATQPAELIVSTGPPTYSSLVGNELLYMSNTEADVVMDVPSHQYYVLLSGRWFTGKSLTGPWTYVPPNELPKSFANIPAESDKGYLLASVAGLANRNQFQNLPRPNVPRDMNNNIFADRNGNVYRKAADGWQKRDGSTWRKAQPTIPKNLGRQAGQANLQQFGQRTGQGNLQPLGPRTGQGNLQQPGRQTGRIAARNPAQQPNRSRFDGGSAVPRRPAQPAQRPSNMYRGSSSLDRDALARQRGTTRTNNFQKHQSAQRPQSFQRAKTGGGGKSFQRSGGGSRGGGGRRR
jgi:hypothetical protein